MHDARLDNLLNHLLRDTSNLVVFAAVVQSGSITRGAGRLGLERTTVSRRIRDLERAHGAELLNRSGHRVTLTDVGRLCYGHSLRVIQAAEDAAAVASGIGVNAPLVVASPVALMDVLAVVLERDFRPRFPAIEVKLQRTERLSAPDLRGIDMAVCIGSPPLATDRATSRKIATVRQSVVASPDYLERTADLKLPGDLGRHRFIGFGQGNAELAILLQSADVRVALGVVVARAVPDLATARAAAAAGHGFCVLPDFACQEWVERGILAQSSDELSAPPADVHVLCRGDRPLRASAAALLESLTRELGRFAASS